MNKIINLLKEKKSIPLDKFINIALYDKELGYYMKKNPFGEKGDFITSPHISNLFGEMIAIWCVAFWKHLGKPKKIVIVEMGPGDGSLCKNLIEIFKRFNNFYKCLEINLFEISHKLKILQKQKINNKKVKWIKNIKDINSGPIIFLGNEFFDSLPIKQVKKRGKLFLNMIFFWNIACVPKIISISLLASLSVIIFLFLYSDLLERISVLILLSNISLLSV